MDVELNTERLREARRGRAWSQEHLAAVSGLGLRTVQRVEQTGRASFESARSLAAALELEVGQLRAQTPRRRPIVATLGAALAAAFGFALTTSSIADPLLLDFDVARLDQGSGNEVRHVGRVETRKDSATEVEVEGHLKLVVIPTTEPDERIRLSSKLYELKDGDYVLLAQPQLITDLEQEVVIVFGVDGGKSYTLKLTPREDTE